MNASVLPVTAAAVVLSLPLAAASAASVFASSVVSYSPGSGVGPGYDVPSRALGEPTRLTGIGTDYQSTTNPFAPAYESTDLVTVGRGGSLVITFDHPVADDPSNPFGIDLLVFGNSFYSSTGDLADGLFGGQGAIEVSADGLEWRTITGVAADGAFPTLGYLDVTDPFQFTGTVPSDFTRPVDPTFNALGRTFAEIVAAYGTSGGGAGVDLASVGLSSISYVRITTPDDSPFTTQIDAFSDVSSVPAPATLLIALLGLTPRKRR